MAPVGSRHFSQSNSRHYRQHTRSDERSRRDNRYDVRAIRYPLEKIFLIFVRTNALDTVALDPQNVDEVTLVHHQRNHLESPNDEKLLATMSTTIC